ncbi:ABC transporter permease [Streptococcus mitis]|uniref:ABC transporter permease n=1 Tax=Streptococcus mitis TaxID=28037 RepID=A0A6I1U0T9_STRMT|nr:ABC transporter permease [Streptococcus mitis]MQQ30685.1 ABC transporter permease [Streptococcus mitis]
MIQLLKSEMIKFKGSYQLYIILILSTIQLLTIPIYILSVNNTIVLENIIFLPMLGYSMITTIITLLVSEQEINANNYQNIRSGRNISSIWGAKLFVLDLLLSLLTIPLWVVVGIELEHFLYYFYIGIVSWLLLILLNHFHMLLTLFIAKGGNLLIAVVESLFILFATNKVFLNIFWIPVILPVNIILENNFRSTTYLLALIFYVVLLFVANLVIVSRKGV